MKFIFRPRNKLLVSVGENGITATYVVKGDIEKRLFCAATKSEDVEDLLGILRSDSRILVKIFVDHQFQTYAQSVVPGINKLNADMLAAKKARIHTRDNTYQVSNMIYRKSTGRRDWVYLFADYDFQGKVNIWLDFFYKHADCVDKIRALPLESYGVIERLVSAKAEKKEKTFSIKSLFKGGEEKKWELLVTSNKSGGLRITAFFNKNPVFSRLIPEYEPERDFAEASMDIVSEVNNSLEYLRRLNFSIHSIADSSVYIIVSDDVLQHINPDLFDSENVKLFSPFDAVKAMKLTSKIVKARDRFCDPLLLYIAVRAKHKVSSILPLKFRDRYYSNSVALGLSVVMQISFPILLGLSLYFGLYTAYFELKQQQVRAEIEYISTALAKQISIRNEQEGKQSDGLPINHIKEIISVYQKFEEHNIDVLGVISDFAQLNSENIRIRTVNWRVDSGRLQENTQNSRSRDGLRYFIEMDLIFSLKGAKYDEFTAAYEEYLKDVVKFFDCCKVKLESKKNDFSLEDLGKPIDLKLLIEYDV